MKHMYVKRPLALDHLKDLGLASYFYEIISSHGVQDNKTLRNCFRRP